MKWKCEKGRVTDNCIPRIMLGVENCSLHKNVSGGREVPTSCPGPAQPSPAQPSPAQPSLTGNLRPPTKQRTSARNSVMTVVTRDKTHNQQWSQTGRMLTHPCMWKNILQNFMSTHIFIYKLIGYSMPTSCYLSSLVHG